MSMMHVKHQCGKKPFAVLLCLISDFHRLGFISETLKHSQPQAGVADTGKIHGLKDAGRLFWGLPVNAVSQPCEGSPAAAVIQGLTSLFWCTNFSGL